MEADPRHHRGDHTHRISRLLVGDHELRLHVTASGTSRPDPGGVRCRRSRHTGERKPASRRAGSWRPLRGDRRLPPFPQCRAPRGVQPNYDGLARNAAPRPLTLDGSDQSRKQRKSCFEQWNGPSTRVRPFSVSIACAENSLLGGTMEFCRRTTNLRGRINRKTMEVLRRAKTANYQHFLALEVRQPEAAGSTAITPCREAQAQRVEPDKAVGVALVVDRVLLEGDVAEAVEALGRPPADDADQALVELEPYDALDMLLALVDQRLQHLALGREPEAVVDQLRVTRHQLVLQMRGTAVEGQALDPAMCGLQDRAARRLVNTARFHADKSVLDEIEPADAMLPADLVQPRQQRRRG